MKLIVWHGETGRVEQEWHGRIEQGVIDQYESWGKTARKFSLDERRDLNAIFFDGKTLRNRPTLKARLDRNRVPAGGEVKLSGVPAGARVTITDGLNSHVETGDGATIHIALEDRGRYRISIDAFPHLHQVLELSVE